MKSIEVLQEIIKSNSDKYYNEGESDISDSVFDVLKRRLKELEDSANLNSKDRVSDKVGAPPRGVVWERPYPMLSLDNVFSTKELEDWLDALSPKTMVAIEPKLDGMSLELVYEEGVLIRATTRGDGLLGEVVTEHAKCLMGVPLKIKQTRTDGPVLLVRGEVVISRVDFEVANAIAKATGKQPNSNPRNMVAGILRRNDTSTISDNKLTFLCYEVLTEIDGKWQSKCPVHFPTGFYCRGPEFIGPHDLSRADLLAAIGRGEGLRDNYPFDIDGLVIKCNNMEDRTKLGSGNTSPNWAIAYKFPAQEGISTLQDISWQIGRTGTITPVAKIVPVHVCGVMISSVSLYNVDEIGRLGLYRGCQVVVARMGDVIPKIVSVINVNGDIPIEFPIIPNCPSCDTILIRDGVELVCPNHDGCEEQLVQSLVHFASRVGMDIKGLGEAVAKMMVSIGIVEPALIYDSTLFEQLEPLIGNKTYLKLHENVQKSIRTPFFKVLRSIGISDVGNISAEIIANKYQSFKELSESTVDELSSMPYIGKITAESIVNELTANLGRYLKLDSIFTYEKIKKVDQDLSGKTFVVTGSMFGDKTRSEVEADVKSRGGKVTGTVSKNTNCVYVGTNPGKSKLNKALELGVTTVEYF